MKTRKVLYADNGMVLTNGKTYGKQIFLGENATETDYYEISEQEYKSILEENKRYHAN